MTEDKWGDIGTRSLYYKSFKTSELIKGNEIMNLDEEILINKYGQDLVSADVLMRLFNSFDFSWKKVFLTDLSYLIIQSKPKDQDIVLAIKRSKLKPTFTPCVLLSKGVANHNLKKVIGLREDELSKALLLLLELFKIAYSRRYQIEKNLSGKWWYQDLSDEEKLREMISKI